MTLDSPNLKPSLPFMEQKKMLSMCFTDAAFASDHIFW